MSFASQGLSNTVESTTAARKPRIESQWLFQGNSEIVTVHHEEEYSFAHHQEWQAHFDQAKHQPASQRMRRLMPASENNNLEES